jgi:hypothetical protein
MNEPQAKSSEEQFRLLADQHNAMLKRLSNRRFGYSNSGPRAGASARRCRGRPLDPQQEEARKRLKENLTVARLALEIHREVKRQIRSRYNLGWQ